MSPQTYNHDSRRVFMIRWYFPAVTFLLCAGISPKGTLAEPTESGYIRGVPSPQKASVFLHEHKKDVRRRQKQQRQQRRRLEVEDDCQPTYSNDHEEGMTRATTTNCKETTKSNPCDNARVMPDDGTKIVMNTTNAPLLGPQCNSTYNGKGYWFEIEGKGRHVEMSTCHEETSIPTVISVYQSSKGGCGTQLSCSAFKTTRTSGCSPLRFFAEDDIIYKISVLGHTGTISLHEAQDQIIGLSITREVTCPCWTASELLSTTPITNEYLAQSCNTINTDNLGDSNFDMADSSTSIFILDTMYQGATISRMRFNESRIECSLEGSLINRSIQDMALADEVEVCLGLLYDRCTELSFEGAVWSMFQEACSPDDFVDTILLSDDDVNDGEYMDCLKVGTDVPTPMPSRKPVVDHPHHQS